MVRVSSPAKLRPWSELTAKMVMRVVPGVVSFFFPETGEAEDSRLSFPATGPPDPGRVSEGSLKGSLKGF